MTLICTDGRKNHFGLSGYDDNGFRKFVRPEMVAIPFFDGLFCESGGRPRCWRIWIGRHVRREHPCLLTDVYHSSQENSSAWEVQPRGLGSNTQTTTICVGEHLLIHVSSEAAWSIVRRWRVPAPIGGDLVGGPSKPQHRVLAAGPRSLATELPLIANEFSNRVPPPTAGRVSLTVRGSSECVNR